MRRLTLPERLEAKRIYIPESTCWYWEGHLDRDGYAKIHVGDRPVMAHRLAYELTKGPIEKGKSIDHLCRNRECTNPDHLEPVTPRENTMRSPIAIAAVNSRMNKCKRGHELSFKSYPSKSQRFCPTCRKNRRNSITNIDLRVEG